MKTLIMIALVGLLVPACNSDLVTGSRPASMTPEEKHRLYSAALAASESPLDTDMLKHVCKDIGIFDPDGKPNDQYTSFISEHVNWGLKSESDQFKGEIR